MEIQCKHCGATLHYEPGTTSLVCEYCGSRTDINEEGAAKAQTPTASYIVPFALDRDGAITAARSYMAAGSTTPDDLTTRAEILNVSFVYVPAWDCSGSYTTHWNASFGYDRQETRRVYSNLNKRWGNTNAYRHGLDASLRHDPRLVSLLLPGLFKQRLKARRRNCRRGFPHFAFGLPCL